MVLSILRFSFLKKSLKSVLEKNKNHTHLMECVNFAWNKETSAMITKAYPGRYFRVKYRNHEFWKNNDSRIPTMPRWVSRLVFEFCCERNGYSVMFLRFRFCAMFALISPTGNLFNANHNCLWFERQGFITALEKILENAINSQWHLT